MKRLDPQIKRIINDEFNKGTPHSETANKLNKLGLVTPRGTIWTGANVSSKAVASGKRRRGKTGASARRKSSVSFDYWECMMDVISSNLGEESKRVLVGILALKAPHE